MLSFCALIPQIVNGPGGGVNGIIALAQPPIRTGPVVVEAVNTGVKLGWSPIADARGYRVFRSVSSGAVGISVAEFPIDGYRYVDVNVDANSSYCYTLYAILKEADPQTGESETLGWPQAMGCVTTKAVITGGNTSEMGKVKKKLVLLRINDPYMLLDGKKQEIDPGRGTAPEIINGRAVAPVRAIIEAMNGTVGWNQDTREILLAANGHTVSIWLDKRDISVDGVKQTMDAAPVSVNGRTMVPIRFAVEKLGCVVEWLEPASEIVIMYFSS